VAILTEAFRGFPQSLQVNVRIKLWSRTQPAE